LKPIIQVFFLGTKPALRLLQFISHALITSH
jgi:hypothetical protein